MKKIINLKKSLFFYKRFSWSCKWVPIFVFFTKLVLKNSFINIQIPRYLIFQPLLMAIICCSG
jgi:hypothetical protein